MIEFISGPNKNFKLANSQEERKIRRCMSNFDAPCWRLNEIYNNGDHFSFAQFNYDTDSFLNEIWDIANCSVDTLEVMGSVHSDPFGHSSMMIGQYNEKGIFVPVVVKDYYIRFKVAFGPKSKRKLNILKEGYIYHFLVKRPEIVMVMLPIDTHPVCMMPIEEYMTPTFANSKKKIQINFIDDK
jgi:hypothetical protein